MFFDPIDIPDELLDAQQQGRLVVFAGAGVSMGAPSNLPSFKGLAGAIAKGHPMAADLCEYGDRLDRFLGELSRHGVKVQESCRATLHNAVSKPTELHRSLVDLFIQPKHLRIVTTNFDNHFSSVLAERGWQSDSYFAPALPLGNQFSGLVYLHGSIKRPEPLVLTDEDFGRAYLTEGWAREFLQRLFTEFTTLFIGYRHNDLPVEYLARGMSGKSIAPRFVLAAAGEADQWASLGIREITYEKNCGQNQYANLHAGVRKWAEFTKHQPIDIAERVKAIVCAPEKLDPDKSQSSLLKWCLEREDSCHFFTSAAKGWRWVRWVEAHGFLPPLFNPSLAQLNKPQEYLAEWLSKELLAETSDKGLLLVESQNCVLGQHLWSALRQELWLNSKVDWSSPMIHQWVLLLAETCPRRSITQLSRLLPNATKAAPHTLGMALLRRLLSFNMEIRRKVDWERLKEGTAPVDKKEEAEFEIVMPVEVPTLVKVWNDLITPHFPVLAERLILLLDTRLREANEIYHTVGRADATFDPNCFRGRIYEKEQFPTARGTGLVLDFLLDIVKAVGGKDCGQTTTRIESWLASGVPVLVRVGLYSLHLSKQISGKEKVKLVQQHKLLFPNICGATHESWLVLGSCYPSLDASEKASLWAAVNEGPQSEPSSNISPENWNLDRIEKINRLTWFIGANNQGCPDAQQALDKLKERTPNFRGYVGIDQVVFGDEKVGEGSRSPKTASELLEEAPGPQLDWLLVYQGGTAPFEESRKGLLYQVGEACAKNNDWGVALLEALASRQEWRSELWDTAFWRLKLTSLPQDKLDWLLETLELHFANAPSLRGLSFFLFNSIDLSQDRRPGPQTLEKLIHISLLIWNQIKQTESAVRQGFKPGEWSSFAINHEAGHLTEFWLKYCDFRRTDSNGANCGFPDWLEGPLKDMVNGADCASQLGRVTLGLNFRFVYHLDPAWVRENLLPKFQFSKIGEEAFLMWEPHAGYGALSRDLILEMPPIYREAFKYFHDVPVRMRTGFYRHIAAMVYSCLFDVNESNWLSDFLIGLSDDEKAIWARQVEWGLRGASEARKEKVWQGWMNDYWADRLNGKPCQLLSKEAEVMIEWAFVVGPAFPEAVTFVVQGPQIEKGLGIILPILEKHEAPEKYPESLLRLLIWLLEGHRNNWLIRSDLEKVLFRLPRKKAFLQPLISVCQQLAKLGYSDPADLKCRIEREFTEE